MGVGSFSICELLERTHAVLKAVDLLLWDSSPIYNVTAGLFTSVGAQSATVSRSYSQAAVIYGGFQRKPKRYVISSILSW